MELSSIEFPTTFYAISDLFGKGSSSCAVLGCTPPQLVSSCAKELELVSRVSRVTVYAYPVMRKLFGKGSLFYTVLDVRL